MTVQVNMNFSGDIDHPMHRQVIHEMIGAVREVISKHKEDFAFPASFVVQEKRILEGHREFSANPSSDYVMWPDEHVNVNAAAIFHVDSVKL